MRWPARKWRPLLRGLRGALAGFALAAAFIHCAARSLDVVDLGVGPDASTLIALDGGAVTYVWPNDASHTNSDPWIAAHHDQIVEMDPHVLLLNFANAYDAAATQALVTQHINAFAEATRYHGYKDATARPFLQYQLEKIVDLRDNSGNVDSAILPVSNGNVDYAALNSTAFANLIGIQDPDSPGSYLNLCSLFEKGIIHEVWGMVADPATTVKFAESVETKQAYDPNDQPIVPREMVCASNGPCIDVTVPCKVSTRFYDFNPTRGTGCHLNANGSAWEEYVTSNALPAFTKVAQTFFNLDFQERFNASFSSFHDVCTSANATDVCINWGSSGADGGAPRIRASAGPASSKAFDFSPMTAGCGNVSFPPNATDLSVQAGDLPVLTSCEHYGLQDGSGGADELSSYTNAYVQSLYANNPNASTDCGDAQPMYLSASMPGLGTKALAADGTAMKNWWVYEFY